MFLFPWRNGLVGKSNYLRPIYHKWRHYRLKQFIYHHCPSPAKQSGLDSNALGPFCTSHSSVCLNLSLAVYVILFLNWGAFHTRDWGLGDHWNLKFHMGGKCQDCCASLYTRAWGPKELRNFKWMKHLLGMKWIMFHGLPDFVSSPPQRGGPNTKLGDHDTSNPTTLDLP